ncbi:MAG: RES family NAD+ phosphorylase [Defluviitaleaceae bacterium]|nr:RES family NAD+ phosphorylase [Defluviitaleaceae bacterium]
MDKCDFDAINDNMSIANGGWDEFRKEIIHSNRFFSNAESMLDKLETLFAKCVCLIGGNDNVYFRAREYDVNPSGEFIIKNSKIVEVKHLPLSMIKYPSSISDFYKTRAKGNKTPKSYEQYINLLIPEKIKKSEWGYSKDESGKTPNEKANTSRASPQYISYLYLANDVNTALAETRVQIEQVFNVAQYKITEKKNLVNLRSTILDADEFGSEEFFLLLNVSRAFSTPVYSNDKDYIVSQYIAEFIKSLKYDGLIFDSSRNRGGINYTLFDDSSCEFLCSELYEASDIAITSKRLLPFSDNA